MERLMQAWNIVNQNTVIPCKMENFNTEIVYSREPKQPPQEMHHRGAFGCAFIQHATAALLSQ